ncbi:MAG: L-lysine-epsilon aminotransferase, partial [Mycobacterium sp.]
MTSVLAATDRQLGPDRVHEVLARSILVDGLDFVLDLDRSAGS